MLSRSLTTIELININQMFCIERGYKDLIRDFKKSFNIKLDKQTAKRFMENRSWREVFKYLTGEDIEPEDDNIPKHSIKDYELLNEMLKVSAEDNEEINSLIEEFNNHDYYIEENVKYFNCPLYGEIIAYKRKEPFIKCFLLNEKRKIEKIEDVPITNQLPKLLLSMIRKINSSVILTTDEKLTIDNNDYVIDAGERLNIVESKLFSYLDIRVKSN